MENSSLESIHGNYRIIEQEGYVVFLGKYLQILRPDGGLVTCNSRLSNAFKAAFLPDHTLLVDGGKKEYHLISLNDGTEIWNIPQPRKEFSANRFALSPDFGLAYDYCLCKGDLYFAAIDLRSGTMDSYPVEKELRSTVDIVCDQDGIPCLLQGHFSQIAGVPKSENGILYQYQDIINKGSSYFWKAKWQFDGNRIALSFLFDADTVVTNDLWVYNTKNGSLYYLLKNEPAVKTLADSPVSCKLDSSSRYLIVMYQKYNLVVDIPKRKIAARYAAEYSEGCLIGDQFWVSSKSGIVKKPFPCIEEIDIGAIT